MRPGGGQPLGAGHQLPPQLTVGRRPLGRGGGALEGGFREGRIWGGGGGGGLGGAWGGVREGRFGGGGGGGSGRVGGEGGTGSYLPLPSL